MEETVSRTRVLLVEDHPDTLEALSIILGDSYSVFAYGSAAEAIAAIETARPDALVLDIGMGPVDGVQCLEAIRGIPGYREVPAVAVTGFARKVERQRLLERGFQAVFVKPIFDLEELVALIHGLATGAGAAAPRRTGAPPTRPPARHHLDGRAAVTELVTRAGEPKGSEASCTRDRDAG